MGLNGLTLRIEVIFDTRLAGVYLHGDISTAYPLAWALPVILVGLVTASLSVGKPRSAIGVTGIPAGVILGSACGILGRLVDGYWLTGMG